MTIQFPAALPDHLRRYAGREIWQERTLATWARERAEHTPDEVVYLGEPDEPTYASLLADAEALARSLLDIGIRPGEVVAFQTPNWVEAAIINLAAALAGFVICPIVYIYRDSEVRHILADSAARVYFAPERFRSLDHAAMADRLMPDLPALRQIVYLRPESRQPDFVRLIEHGRGLTHPLAGSAPDAVKLILYTSGTTGRPKAVLHSHNSLARVLDVTFRHLAITPDVVLMPSPVTHVTGYAGALEKPFQLGVKVVLMEQWDAARAVALIERFQVTTTVAATPFLAELLNAARSAGTGLPSLRSFACGGASVPPELVHEANRTFARACVARVYGSSEVPQTTQGYPGMAEPELAAESDGHLLDYEVRVCSLAGEVLEPDCEGELQVRGPGMFLGYGDPAQTALALTADGYFRTGDLGKIAPSGALSVTGRLKDLIIRGGENISAREIEEVLNRHPGVTEAAVVAMPHPRLGEGVCAFVISSGTEALTADVLSAHVEASGLARQKCPERFVFVGDFPRTPSGKVRKDVLRDQARAIVAADTGVQTEA